MLKQDHCKYNYTSLEVYSCHTSQMTLPYLSIRNKMWVPPEYILTNASDTSNTHNVRGRNPFLKEHKNLLMRSMAMIMGALNQCNSHSISQV
jgi:hypothetical protein